VSGSVSVRATGCRLESSGSRDSIAWLSEVPRPAKALPNPSRFVRTLSRVAASKVLLMSSNSVCSTVCSDGKT
jgi:hypothetical protein